LLAKGCRSRKNTVNRIERMFLVAGVRMHAVMRPSITGSASSYEAQMKAGSLNDVSLAMTHQADRAVRILHV